VPTGGQLVITPERYGRLLEQLSPDVLVRIAES
jgi:hypothetical protein